MLHQKKSLIGMIHVGALPGTPKHNQPMRKTLEIALQEAKIYANHGYDAILVENMHDRPYCKHQVGPEITASMAIIVEKIASAVSCPVGVQILAAANCEALAVASAAGASFIRAEGFVFGHVADEGYIDSCAANLLRFRKKIGAEHVKIMTDIKKKHSAHAITEDVSLCETAEAAAFFLSDGLIITGTSTGKPANPLDFQMLRQHTSLPLWVGSGITPDNLENYIDNADGFIVGSYVKTHHHWENELNETHVQTLAQRFQDLAHAS